MTAISGRTCLRSLPPSSLSGSFWKTLVGISAWDSTRCYLTWKTSATPAHRPLFRLLPSTRLTAGIASGLRAAAATLPNRTAPALSNNPLSSEPTLPTPTARDYKASGNPNSKGVIKNHNRHFLAETIQHQEQQHNKRLSARWVNRMMGLPDGWLDPSPAPLMDPRWEGNPLQAFSPSWEDGVPRVVEQEDERVHKLKALGNGIVPQVAFVLLTCMDKAEWA